jgi:hypothetical protein
MLQALDSHISGHIASSSAGLIALVVVLFMFKDIVRSGCRSKCRYDFSQNFTSIEPLPVNGLSERREIHIVARAIVNGIKPKAAGLALFAFG